jgi:hypothetical protein
MLSTLWMLLADAMRFMQLCLRPPAALAAEKTAGASAHTSRRLAVDNQVEPAIIAGHKLQSRKALFGYRRPVQRAQTISATGDGTRGVY